MVQYKAMGKGSDGKSEFRPLSDRNLPGEIDRMDALLAAIQACPANSVHDGFRLTENPFFLKLCSRLVFNPDDVGPFSFTHLRPHPTVLESRFPLLL